VAELDDDERSLARLVGVDGRRYARFDASPPVELSAGMRTLHHPRSEELSLPDVLHALSDPVRLEVVRLLADGEERPCSAVEATVAKSTLSHHFKVLREAGITHTRANGTHRLMSLRKDDLDERFPGLLSSVISAVKVA
jgi:DNA-binding transcriptional ArsR family regulator